VAEIVRRTSIPLFEPESLGSLRRHPSDQPIGSRRASDPAGQRIALRRKNRSGDRRRPSDIPFRHVDFHFDFDFLTRATGNIRTAEAAVGWGVIPAFEARGRTGPTHRERIVDDHLVTCSR
jgi:hypothetical protein